jgi:hypothetical protein
VGDYGRQKDGACKNDHKAYVGEILDKGEGPEGLPGNPARRAARILFLLFADKKAKHGMTQPLVTVINISPLLQYDPRLPSVKDLLKASIRYSLVTD